MTNYSSSDNCKLLDAWNLYLDTKISKSINIQKETSRFFKHIYPYWNNIPLSSIHARDIAIFKKHLFQQELNAKSVHNCLSLLRSLYNRAKKYEIYTGNIPYFEMPKVYNIRTRYLTEDEANVLFATLQDKSELWHDIALFALNTGMQANEIFSLSPKSINLSQKLIIIFDTKNGTTRIIPLNHTAYTIAKKYIFKEQKFLFSNTHFHNVSKIFRRAVAETNINRNLSDPRNKFVFHSLRHTFASWLVQKGTPLQVVSQLLGHKDLKMTQRYAHLAPDQCVYAVEQLPYIHKIK